MLIRTYVLYRHLNRLILQNSRLHSHPRKLHRSCTTIVQYVVYREFLQPLTHKTLVSAAKHHKAQPIDAGGRGQCISHFRMIFIATTDTCICVCGRVIFFASAARMWAYGGRLKDMLLHLQSVYPYMHMYSVCAKETLNIATWPVPTLSKA